MKKLVFLMSLLAGSFLFLPTAFASKDTSRNPPGKNRTNIYHISEVGYGTVFPLGGDRYRIICKGTAGTCWGIAQEGGRWYIDVFDINGNMDSWWLNIFPVFEPTDPDDEGTSWQIDTNGQHGPPSTP